MEPLAALALGLAERGHDVRVGTGPAEREGFEALGLAWQEVDDSVVSMNDANRMRERAAASGRITAGLRHSMTVLRRHRELLYRFLDSAWEVARDADALVFRLPLSAATCFADALRVPCFQIELIPLLTPTREFPNYFFPSWPLGGAYNRLTYDLFRLSAWPIASAVHSWARTRLGLSARRHLLRFDPSPVRWVHCFSPLLVPRPKDWPESWPMTGYCFLDRPRDWSPPEDLVRFLENGPPPVYIGFGSMSRHAERITEVVVQAVARSGRRAILATGRGGLRPAEVPANTLVLAAAPHSWLFPRMAAVVHHGGAGTTAAGLRAGVPSVLCPFQGDQFFWGRRVEQLGLGPAPIPLASLAPETLAAAIERAVTDPAMRREAAEFGRKLRAENGVADTLDLIERAIATHGDARRAPSEPGPPLVKTAGEQARRMPESALPPPHNRRSDAWLP